nr:hypothetical protein [uncultured Methylotenera sp.]
MEIIFERVNIDKIPIYKVKGVVRGLWLGQWESGPADFMIETDSGERFDAGCELEPQEASIKYTLGRECEIEYYKAISKLPEKQNEFYNVVTKISLGNTTNQNVEPIGPCYFTYKKHILPNPSFKRDA